MIIQNRRRVMGKKSLPYDVEVEYLESTGTQYILNIPVTITNATYEIETKINVLSTFNYNNIFSFGRDVTTLECWYAGGFYYRHNQTKIGGSNFGGLNVTYTYKFVFNGTTLVSYKDGVQYSSNNVSNCENTDVLRLFTRQDSNTNNSNFRLYGFSLIKNNIKVLDLIPVRVGQVGYLYDKISGKLFGNSGTGSFIIGPGKNLSYDAEVEYLESTGTQWIDTLLMFDSEYKVELTALLTPSVSEYDIIGNAVRSGAYAGKTVLGFYNNFIFFFNNPNTRVDSSKFAQQETLFNIVIEANNNNRILTVNGDSYTKTGVNYSSEGNIVLFRGGATYMPSSVKIKSFKMTRSGEVVRDLISVRVGQTGYMYDRVSGQLFGNVGTGNFILGNDV